MGLLSGCLCGLFLSRSLALGLHGWLYVGLLVGGWRDGGGITVGFHRRSRIAASTLFVQLAWMALSWWRVRRWSGAIHGGITSGAMTGDPHRRPRGGLLGILGGLWYRWAGSLRLLDAAAARAYVPDLVADPALVPSIAVLFVCVPAWPCRR
jgi:hypothetical protein